MVIGNRQGKQDEMEREIQLKSFKELIVLFLGPALARLGDGVRLPDLLAGGVSTVSRRLHG